MCVCVFCLLFLFSFSLLFAHSLTFSASSSFQTANIVHLIFVIVFISQQPPLVFFSLFFHSSFESFDLDCFLTLHEFLTISISFYGILSLPHILYQLLWFHFKHFQSLKQKFEPKWRTTFRFQFILIIAFIHRYEFRVCVCVSMSFILKWFHTRSNPL